MPNRKNFYANRRHKNELMNSITDVTHRPIETVIHFRVGTGLKFGARSMVSCAKAFFRCHSCRQSWINPAIATTMICDSCSKKKEKLDNATAIVQDDKVVFFKETRGFICKRCSKRTFTKYNLKAHMQTHRKKQ